MRHTPYQAGVIITAWPRAIVVIAAFVGKPFGCIADGLLGSTGRALLAAPRNRPCDCGVGARAPLPWPIRTTDTGDHRAGNGHRFLGARFSLQRTSAEERRLGNVTGGAICCARSGSFLARSTRLE